MPVPEQSEQLERVLRQEILARKTFRKRIIERIYSKRTNILLCMLVFVILCVFIVSALLRNKGLFTVAIPRDNMIALGLVLSDEPEFHRPRHELRSPPVVGMWNTTESMLPDDIDQIDGSHNTETYLAYTFYIKNIGEKTILYNASIDITDMYLAVDEAMRVKIYLEGEPTVYGKRAKNGEPEPGAIPFYSGERVMRLDDRELAPGQVEKYTVVVWLEGEDPECINDIMGGFIRMVMDFDGRAPSENYY